MGFFKCLRQQISNHLRVTFAPPHLYYSLTFVRNVWTRDSSLSPHLSPNGYSKGEDECNRVAHHHVIANINQPSG